MSVDARASPSCDNAGKVRPAEKGRPPSVEPGRSLLEVGTMECGPERGFSQSGAARVMAARAVEPRSCVLATAIPGTPAEQAADDEPASCTPIHFPSGAHQPSAWVRWPAGGAASRFAPPVRRPSGPDAFHPRLNPLHAPMPTLLRQRADFALGCQRRRGACDTDCRGNRLRHANNMKIWI